MISGWIRGVSTVVCVGAHPDDIEIGSAGALLSIADASPTATFVFALLAGTPERIAEAEASAAALLPGRVSIEAAGFDDSYLPYREPARVKEWLSEFSGFKPDAVFAPFLHDRHQDHRFVAELAWQTFRGATIFEYEIPKWEGDRPESNMFFALDGATMEAKTTHLMGHFPSQHGKPWYSREVFEAVARARGIEVGVPFAEGFVARRITWTGDGSLSQSLAR